MSVIALHKTNLLHNCLSESVAFGLDEIDLDAGNLTCSAAQIPEKGLLDELTGRGIAPAELICIGRAGNDKPVEAAGGTECDSLRRMLTPCDSEAGQAETEQREGCRLRNWSRCWFVGQLLDPK